MEVIRWKYSLQGATHRLLYDMAIQNNYCTISQSGSGLTIA